MKLFQKNVGKTDRVVRFVVGLVLFAAGAFYLGSPLAYVAYFLGLILIATGALGTCALYSLLNFTTLEPGEGCKCKEGEPCECTPECKVCKEEISVDIPEEAEEKEKPAFFAPAASARAPAPVAKKAPAKKAAPKAKRQQRKRRNRG